MPEGGDVTVVYSLRLTPDGTVEDADSKQAAVSPPVERVKGRGPSGAASL